MAHARKGWRPFFSLLFDKWIVGKSREGVCLDACRCTVRGRGDPSRLFVGLGFVPGLSKGAPKDLNHIPCGARKSDLP